MDIDLQEQLLLVLLLLLVKVHLLEPMLLEAEHQAEPAQQGQLEVHLVQLQGQILLQDLLLDLLAQAEREITQVQLDQPEVILDLQPDQVIEVVLVQVDLAQDLLVLDQVEALDQVEVHLEEDKP